MKELVEGKIPIHVVGYPKSGNTWLTRLVGDALNSPTGNRNLRHNLEIASEGNNRPGPYYILKSHSSKIFNGAPSIKKDSCILYIVRDFRDVLVSSFFHHYKINENLVLLKDFCTKKSLSRIIWRNFIFKLEIRKLTNGWGSLLGGSSFYHFIKGNLRGRWLHHFKVGDVGTWSGHVNYWMNYSSIIRLIRYEDLLENPYDTLAKTFRDLKIQFDKERLLKAIKAQSFENRKNEFLVKNEKLLNILWKTEKNHKKITFQLAF